jgi:hypothetical protein
VKLPGRRLAVLALTGGLITLTACSSGGTTHSAPASPAPSSVPAKASVASGAKPVTLLDKHGSGQAWLPFKAGSSGDYIVSWTFSNNGAGLPSGTEFGIDLEGGNNAGSTIANGGELPSSEMADSGSGSAEILADWGAHDFSVGASSGCTWTLKVVSAP